MIWVSYVNHLINMCVRAGVCVRVRVCVRVLCACVCARLSVRARASVLEGGVRTCVLSYVRAVCTVSKNDNSASTMDLPRRGPKSKQRLNYSLQ